jgi:predicted nucleotidyltransferase
MTLLQQMDQERLERREALRLEMRSRLKSVLRRLIPADRVVVFGSLIRPSHFHEASDIDVALEVESEKIGLYQLIGLLAEEMGRPVDVVLLSECRFRDRIEREGEVWTLAD